MATYIFVHGVPGSGKSTVLQKLSRDLNVGYIAKDDIKEYLGDHLYVKNEKIDPYYYGNASSSSLYTIIRSFVESDKVMLVESAFWADLTEKELKLIFRGHHPRLLQVYITCDQSIAVKRFNNRIECGERHFIHPDTLYKDGSNYKEVLKKYRPLRLDTMTTYVLDTTSDSKKTYQQLLDEIQYELKGEINAATN